MQILPLCSHEKETFRMLRVGLCYNVGVLDEVYVCPECKRQIILRVLVPLEANDGVDNRKTAIQTKDLPKT